MLAILDDGHGMSHEEIMKMMSFGRKEPNANDPNYIGRYGVGFKVLFSWFSYMIMQFSSC